MLLCTAQCASAQNFDTLNINNISAVFNPGGDLFYNVNTSGTFIQAPGNSIAYSLGNLWIGGYDSNGRLHVSALTYRQTGADFWPGPMDTTAAMCPQAASNAYNYVWKVGCAEVDSFVRNQTVPIPGYPVPPDIQTWPGNGDPTGGQGQFLAPFVDVDGDQYYNYQAGDYPSVRGEQALYYIYNDSLQYNPHGETQGISLGVQIEAMPFAYAYPWDEALMNTIFIHYTITNYRTFTYTGTRIGFWSGFDFYGSATGAGSDSLLGVAYHYNDDNAVGIYFLSEPMDGCISYENNLSPTGNPQTPLGYFELMQHNWSSSDALTYGGTGINTGDTTNWMFTGNPAANTGWLDPGVFSDRRQLSSTDSFTLLPGMSKEFVVAISFAYDPAGNNASFTKLNQYVGHVRQFYAGNNGFCTPMLNSVNEQSSNAPAVYPNPAVDAITLTGTSANETYFIYNAQGQLVATGKTQQGSTIIAIDALSTGMYLIQTDGENQRSSSTFFKTE